ncbi:MAG TPA: glycosyltransferase family 39 protein, partial [Saprospiraceae bacterium]|nr:glycosyltransferase family 39 protein [Saprospiraceae bacterium]
MLTSTNNLNKKTGFLNILIVATTILVGAVFIYYRINYLYAPLGNDESVYLYLGKMAMHGGALYRDFYEMKPPMLFYSYGFLNALTGFSILGLHLNAIVIVLLTSFLIYKTYIRKYQKLPTMLACTIWALLFSSPMIYGNYLQSEHFVALFLVLIFYLLQFRSPSNRQIFISGLLYGAAILTKQTAIFFIVPGLFLIYELGNTKKERLQKLLIFTAGSLVIALFFLLVILAYGTYDDMMYWLFEFPSSYVGRITWENGQNYLLSFARQIFEFNAYFFGMVALALIFVFYGYKKRLNW